VNVKRLSRKCARRKRRSGRFERLKKLPDLPPRREKIQI
jgi:hypothetical protein